MRQPPVYFAIPAMDERDTLPHTLDCIAGQDYKGALQVWICVNGPYTDCTQDSERFRHNRELWQRLTENPWNLPLHLIDRFSPTMAWRTKQAGVGVARRTCMEALLPHAHPEGILISMDADTVFNKGFVTEVVRCIQQSKEIAAVNPPYFHPLSGNDSQDRAMLRYEIYLRCYLIQLLRIRSPYAFTALGSAICCSIGNYRKCGGFDSQQAGEDFYLLQKLAKMGRIALHCKEKVYPSSRLSDRVPFGTGPAIRAFQEGNTRRYPIFPFDAFEAISLSYQQIGKLWKEKVSTPLTDFLDQTSGHPEDWDKLRKNYPKPEQFTKAFHQKADGLRLFQFLRNYTENHPTTGEEALGTLWCYMEKEHPQALSLHELPSDFRLDEAATERLHRIRLDLASFETWMRTTH